MLTRTQAIDVVQEVLLLAHTPAWLGRVRVYELVEWIPWIGSIVSTRMLSEINIQGSAPLSYLNQNQRIRIYHALEGKKKEIRDGGS